MHTRSNPDTIMPGERILLGEKVNSYRNGRNRSLSAFAIVTIDGLDGRHLTGTDELGEKVRIDTRRDKRDEQGRQILWDSPLPAGTDEQIRRFCSVMLDGGDYDGALFAIDDVTGNIATGRFIASRSYRSTAKKHAEEVAGTEWEGKLLPVPLATTGNTVFAGTVAIVVPEQPSRKGDGSLDRYGISLARDEPCTWKSGDLVACVDYSCAIVDGTMTYTLEESIVVGNFVDDDAISNFLPAKAPSRHGILLSSDPGLGSFSKRQHEEVLANVSLEPDEALVLVHGSNGTGDPTCSVLMSTGRTFFIQDEIDIYLSAIAPGDGLWVLEKARFWSSNHDGEYDGGIEGDWRPAILDDLERFGMDLEGAKREIVEALEKDVEDFDNIVDLQIAMAESDCKANAVPTPA